MRALRSLWSTQPRPAKQVIRAPLHPASVEARLNVHTHATPCCACAPRLPAMDSGYPSRLAESPSSSAALVADDVGDDFRRGCRGVHAFDWCGSAAKSYGADRANGG